MEYSDALTAIKLIKLTSFTPDSYAILLRGLLSWTLLIRDHIPTDLREIYCVEEIIITIIYTIILHYTVSYKK